MKALFQLTAAFGILSCVVACASGQGFVNLSFERAGFFLPTTPPGEYGTSEVDPNLAFNGWTITNAMGPGHYVSPLYNNLTLGSSGVVLVGPQFPNALNISPLQGSYSVMLQGFGNTNFVGLPGMLQSGMIAADVRSISFLTSTTVGGAAGRLRLDGVEVPLFSISNNRIAGDISAFAGRNVEMMISTLPGQGWFYFDDVRFSTVSVPEPSMRAMAFLALATFAIIMKRRNSSR